MTTHLLTLKQSGANDRTCRLKVALVIAGCVAVAALSMTARAQAGGITCKDGTVVASTSACATHGGAASTAGSGASGGTSTKKQHKVADSYSTVDGIKGEGSGPRVKTAVTQSRPLGSVAGLGGTTAGNSKVPSIPCADHTFAASRSLCARHGGTTPTTGSDTLHSVSKKGGVLPPPTASQPR